VLHSVQLCPYSHFSWETYPMCEKLWCALKFVKVFIGHDYLADFFCIFEDSIPGNGIAPMIAELSASTK
jgi:hypothetical protein